MSGRVDRAVRIGARISLGIFALLGAAHIAMLTLRPEMRGMGPSRCAQNSSEGLRLARVVVRNVLGDAPLFDNWTGTCTFAGQNAELLKSGQPVEIVFIGDSITEQWPGADPALFSPSRPNRGISGHSAAQVLTRLPSDVVALHPRVVHVLAGTNDVLGVSGPSTPAIWQGTMRAIVNAAQAEGITVILGTLPPMSRNPFDSKHRPAGIIAEQNRFLAALAKEKGAILADYHTALPGPGGGFAEGMSSDEIHLSPKGYAAMRKVLDKALLDASAQARP